MNRASIGIQDFTDIVQNAIGREQPFENTKPASRRCAATVSIR